MRSVFSDLSSEVQRSIGFYTTLNRQAKVKRVLAVGNTFRLSGLQKYLQQSLRIEFVRVDEFSRLTLGPQVRSPAFSASILSLGVAYGLALQGLGRASIDVNLLPPSIARQQVWRAKKPMFAAAVALLAFIVAAAYARNFMDLSGSNRPLNDNAPNAPMAIIQGAERYKKDQTKAEAEVEAEQKKVEEYAELLSYQDVFPVMVRAISRTLDVCEDPDAEMNKPRSQRRLIFLQNFSCRYSEDLDKEFAEKYGIEEASAPAAPAPAPVASSSRNTRNRNTRASQTVRTPAVVVKPKKGFIMEIRAITPFQGDSQYNYVSAFLDEEVAKGLPGKVEAELKALAVEDEKLSNLLAEFRLSAPLIYKMAPVEKTAKQFRQNVGVNVRTEEKEGIEFADPTRPNESMANDCYFCIPWKVYLGADAEKKDSKDATSAATRMPAAASRGGGNR